MPWWLALWTRRLVHRPDTQASTGNTSTAAAEWHGQPGQARGFCSISCNSFSKGNGQKWDVTCFEASLVARPPAKQLSVVELRLKVQKWTCKAWLLFCLSWNIFNSLKCFLDSLDPVEPIYSISDSIIPLHTYFFPVAENFWKWPISPLQWQCCPVCSLSHDLPLRQQQALFKHDILLQDFWPTPPQKAPIKNPK